MADINKIKLPSGADYNIKDYRIPGVDTTPTSGSNNVVTSGGIYNSIKDFESFYFVQGSSSAAGNSTSGSYLSTKWEGTVPGVSTATNGLKIAYRIATNAGVSTAGVVLSIDGTNYYPVVIQKNTLVTSHYPVGATVLMVFNSTQTASAYLTSNTKTTVTGCWQIMEYDSNTNTYQRLYASSGNTEYPITTRYNTTTGDSYYAEYGRYSEGVTLNPSTNTITASAFKVDGGTSSQVLKADGSLGTIDSTPTANSSNLVTSGGVRDAIDTAIGSVYRVKGTKATYAELPSSGNVSGDVWNVTAAYGNYPAGTNWVWTGSAWDALGGAIDLSGKQDVLTFDSTPTANSTNPVTSGGIYTAVESARELVCLEYTAQILQPSEIQASDLSGAYTAAIAALNAGKIPYLKINCAGDTFYYYLEARRAYGVYLPFFTIHNLPSNSGDECYSYYIKLNSDSSISAGNIPLVQRINIDSTPTEYSNNAVSSGGVYDVIVENEEVTSAALNDLNEKIESFEESDPIFTNSPAYNITSANITSWNNKVSNVQSDWNATTGAAVILNKPTIPAAPGTLNTTATTAQSTNASEALSGSVTLHKIAKTGTYSDLIGTPTIPAELWEAGAGSNSIQQKTNDAIVALGIGSVAIGEGAAVGNFSYAEGSGRSVGFKSHAEGGGGMLYSGYKITGSGTSYTLSTTDSNLTLEERLLLNNGSTNIVGCFLVDFAYRFYRITSQGSISNNSLAITVAKTLGNKTDSSIDLYTNCCTAYGDYSHAEGNYTTTYNSYEHAQGIYNVSNAGTTNADKTIHSVGVGVIGTTRMNALEIMYNGDVYVKGIGSYDGTNYSSASTLQSVVNGASPNDSTITIQMNGAMVDSFTTNAASAKTINLGTVITSHQDISGKANVATTLSGYGITDATISGQTVTLGSNSVTVPQILSGTSDPSSNQGNNGDIYIKLSS